MRLQEDFGELLGDGSGQWRDTNRGKEGRGNPRIGTPIMEEGVAALSWLCELLL